MLSIYNIKRKNNNIHDSNQFLKVGVLHFKPKKLQKLVIYEQLSGTKT